ncbi:hypothetical protein EKN07_02075 [Actinobaculum sp. 352]|nr:hypothetical protein EKN07_02075 [Actinobaculum sp. 352]
MLKRHAYRQGSRLCSHLTRMPTGLPAGESGIFVPFPSLGSPGFPQFSRITRSLGENPKIRASTPKRQAWNHDRERGDLRASVGAAETAECMGDRRHVGWMSAL